MSRTEFKRIKSNLSCEVKNIDKMYPGGVGSNRDIAKIGVFLEMFRERCRQVYQPGEHLSYDEQVAKTDSRYTTLRQVLKHKKYNGIQIYRVCEAGSGYLGTCATKFGDAPRVREDAMLSLLADVQGRWHRVYADNLFINLRVLRDARDISVYLCGTARTNFGFPRPISRDVVKDLSKGEYTWRMSDDGITAILWHDTVPTQFPRSDPLSMLSTYSTNYVKLQITTYFFPTEECLQQAFKNARVCASRVRRQAIRPQPLILHRRLRFRKRVVFVAERQ